MLWQGPRNQPVSGTGVVSSRHDACERHAALSRSSTLFRRGRAAGISRGKTRAFLVPGCPGETVDPTIDLTDRQYECKSTTPTTNMGNGMALSPGVEETSMSIHKVLVVEDDPDIQKLIRMSLKVRGVHDVVLASDGEECLAVVQNVRPDLILMDVTMPRLDGHETCRSLKADPQTRFIPVIFLSAKTQKGEEEIGSEAGALGYLTKPFDPMTLLTQISGILDKAEVPK